jgi:hypothetical protein
MLLNIQELANMVGSKNNLFSTFLQELQYLKF